MSSNRSLIALALALTFTQGQALAASADLSSQASTALSELSEGKGGNAGRCQHLKDAADDFWNNVVEPLYQQWQDKVNQCNALRAECDFDCSDLEQECDAIDQECAELAADYDWACIDDNGQGIVSPYCSELAQQIAQCTINSNSCQNDLGVCQEDQDDCAAEVAACDDAEVALMQVVNAAVQEWGDLSEAYDACMANNPSTDSDGDDTIEVPAILQPGNDKGALIAR